MEIKNKFSSFQVKRNPSRRSRTISHTQQFNFPLQDTPVDDNESKISFQWYKTDKL